jgi:Rps23 Pro-64 3,4-dihydroxylase Tpa1-like proline 4-hydroxylase
MREVIKNSRFVVWDDILSSEDFGQLLVHVSKSKFHSPHRNGWESVWKSTDGECMRTQALYTENFPTKTPLDKIFEVMTEACLINTEICGINPSNWDKMTVSSYIYPSGTRLSWHGDGGAYSAALTYYCHPRWSPHWGGELLVAETPNQNYIPKLDYDVAPGVDHSQIDAWINAYGMGHMIVPKPNRLVLMKSGICHMVNRVDLAAGDNLRMSVVGFTMTPQAVKGVM